MDLPLRSFFSIISSFSLQLNICQDSLHPASCCRPTCFTRQSRALMSHRSGFVLSIRFHHLLLKTPKRYRTRLMTVVQEWLLAQVLRLRLEAMEVVLAPAQPSSSGGFRVCLSVRELLSCPTGLSRLLDRQTVDPARFLRSLGPQ